MENTIIKGALVFGVVSLITFISLIILGIVLFALGISCDCYQHISLVLIIAAAATAGYLWFGTCQNCDENK